MLVLVWLILCLVVCDSVLVLVGSILRRFFVVVVVTLRRRSCTGLPYLSVLGVSG